MSIQAPSIWVWVFLCSSSCSSYWHGRPSKNGETHQSRNPIEWLMQLSPCLWTSKSSLFATWSVREKRKESDRTRVRRIVNNIKTYVRYVRKQTFVYLKEKQSYFLVGMGSMYNSDNSREDWSNPLEHVRLLRIRLQLLRASAGIRFIELFI